MGKIPIGTFDKPGNTIFRNDLCSENKECGISLVSSYSTKKNINETGSGKNDDNLNGERNDITCTAKQRIELVRNGSTFGSKYCNENKNYHSSTKEYLKARCNNTNCKQNNNSSCCSKTIYKPINKKYSTNTAVSSSSRIARLKYDTVTKSAQGQRNIWGPEVASASIYTGRPEAPYITKSKFQACVSKVR